MKLSRVILENKKIIERSELALTTEDVQKLTTNIANKLETYLDVENRKLLESSITAAIKELMVE